MSDHTPRTARKWTHNFGRPANANSDFYIQTLFEPGLVDTQYNVPNFFVKTCKYHHFNFLHYHTELRDLFTNIYIAID